MVKTLSFIKSCLVFFLLTWPAGAILNKIKFDKFLLNKDRVDDQTKLSFIQSASALLFPIRWNEPFGLVILEALACGTPVISTNRAASPEIIKDGVTGFLFNPEEPNVDSFVDAINKLDLINRNDCRESVINKYDIDKVSKDILKVFQDL